MFYYCVFHSKKKLAFITCLYTVIYKSYKFCCIKFAHFPLLDSSLNVTYTLKIMILFI